jgi:hypothetical protein
MAGNTFAVETSVIENAPEEFNAQDTVVGVIV